MTIVVSGPTEKVHTSHWILAVCLYVWCFTHSMYGAYSRLLGRMGLVWQQSCSSANPPTNVNTTPPLSHSATTTVFRSSWETYITHRSNVICWGGYRSTHCPLCIMVKWCILGVWSPDNNPIWLQAKQPMIRQIRVTPPWFYGWAWNVHPTQTGWMVS